MTAGTPMIPLFSPFGIRLSKTGPTKNTIQNYAAYTQSKLIRSGDVETNPGPQKLHPLKTKIPEAEAVNSKVAEEIKLDVSVAAGPEIKKDEAVKTVVAEDAKPEASEYEHTKPKVRESDSPKPGEICDHNAKPEITKKDAVKPVYAEAARTEM